MTGYKGSYYWLSLFAHKSLLGFVLFYPGSFCSLNMCLSLVTVREFLIGREVSSELYYE